MISFINGQTASLKRINFRVLGEVFRDIEHLPQNHPQNPSKNQHVPLRDLLCSLAKEPKTSIDDISCDISDYLLLPGGIDAHVHSRSPGLEYKEDWHSLARAAYKGGVTCVADMPNTIPPLLFEENIEEKKNLATDSGLIYKLYLGVSDKNVSQLAFLLNKHAGLLAGLKVFYGRSTGNLLFSDLMALHQAIGKESDPLITFHAEDQSIIDTKTKEYSKHMNSLEYSAFIYHSRIRPAEAAVHACEHILQWGLATGRRIHIAHISAPEEVELVLKYREKGLRCTCEIAPHHLLLSEDDYARLGPFAKVNPPIRSWAEVEKMRELFAAGLIDVFATDHAPHLKEEKLKPLAEAPSGMPAIELFYPLLLQCATVTGLSLEQACAMGSMRPAELLGFERHGQIKEDYYADFTLVKKGPNVLNSEYKVASKCSWTPYQGVTLDYQVVATFQGGRIRYLNSELLGLSGERFML